MQIGPPARRKEQHDQGRRQAREPGHRVGGEEVEAGPGEVHTVEPGTAHRFWNAGDEEVRFVCEVRPALDFESLIETMFTLAAEGRTNRRGCRTRSAWR